MRIRGSLEFIEDVSKIIEGTLSISKMEDSCFRYCGVDVSMDEHKIVISMEDYVKSLPEVPVMKRGSKVRQLNQQELTLLRMITGKLSWLAMNCRPDLQFKVHRLSTSMKEATTKELYYAKKYVDAAKSGISRLEFHKCMNRVGEVTLYGIGDASFQAKPNNSIGGELILIGVGETNRVMPLYWKTKIIRRVC